MSSRFLADLPISRKTGLISIVSIAGFMALIAGTLILQAYQKRVTADYERSQVAVLTTKELSNQFLLARRAEKDFLLRLDSKYVDRHRKIGLEISRLVGDLRDDLPVQAANIAAFVQGYRKYEDQFGIVAAAWEKIGFDEESGLRGSLRASVHKAEERLNQLEADNVTVTLLMMRRHEKDFLLRLDEKYIGRLAKRREEIVGDLDEAGITGSDRSDILTLLDAYKNDFDSLASARLQLVQDVSVLSSLFAETSPIADEIIKAVNAMADRAKADLAETTSMAETGMLVFGIVIALIVLVFSLLIGRLVSRPLTLLAGQMEALSDGDKSIQPDISGKDEIGAMGRVLLQFRDKLEEADRVRDQQQAEVQARLERGERRRILTEKFKEQVSQVLESLSSSSGKLKLTSDTMTRLSEESNSRVNSVSEATYETNTNVQTVAAATEELTASVREISGQTMNASQIAETAVREAETGNQVIGELSESAKRINEVITLIQDIAEQTNLLALNATIEAARAGDAGKGFAVVANEVKSLANQTGKATEEIASQINEVSARVEQAVSSISAVLERIGEVANVSTSISAAVEEQSSATEEISRNVDHAASATTLISEHLGQVSESANAVGDASGDVLTASGEVSREIEALKKSVDDYLREVTKD